MSAHYRSVDGGVPHQGHPGLHPHALPFWMSNALHVIKAKGICRHRWLTSNLYPGVLPKAFFQFRFGTNVISSFG
jgi:hypothetical protein